MGRILKDEENVMKTLLLITCLLFSLAVSAASGPPVTPDPGPPVPGPFDLCVIFPFLPGCPPGPGV